MNRKINLLLIIILLFSYINSQEEEENDYIEAEPEPEPELDPDDPENSELAFVFEMFRHGARAPYTGVIDGKDIYGQEWDIKEELSYVGRRMHYLLGVRNRKRYVEKYKFLSEHYEPHEIYITSTDVNRTLESIQAQLQGLYNTSVGEKMEPDSFNETDIFKKRPKNNNSTKIFEEAIQFLTTVNGSDAAIYNYMELIPFHVIDYSLHKFHLQDTNLCPGAKEFYLEAIASAETQEKMKSMTEKYGDALIDYEKKVNSSAQKEDFLYNYTNMFKYADTLICDDTDGRDVKNVLKDESKYEEFKNDCLDFLKYDYLDINYHNRELGVLTMTHTMRTVLQYMDIIVEGKNTTGVYSPKMLIISAHDITMAGFEVFNNQVFQTNISYSKFAQPGFYELYKKKDDKNNYYVRYVFGDINNETRFYDMKYTEFKQKILDKLWSDDKINEFCGFNNNDNDEDNNENDPAKIAAIVLGGIDGVILIAIIVLFICRKKRIKTTTFETKQEV